MIISVIVPIYNLQDFVEDCLESINRQTYTEYEVIVVDDCSTDNSKSIAEKFLKAHEKFSLLPLETNGGLMHAWMEGVKMSKGDYIFFVDNDDTLVPNALETLIKIVEEYDVDIACGNSIYDTRRYGGGLTYHNNYVEPGLYTDEKLICFQKAIFPTTKHHYFSPSRFCKLFKRDLLLSNLKYCDTSISSAEDVNIVIPCVLSAKRIYYIDEPIYYYLQRPSSISRTFRRDTLDMYNRLIDRLSAAIQDKGITYLTKQFKDLYSFYGMLWSRYVMISNLNVTDKKIELARLFNPEYKYYEASKLLNYKYGVRAILYKYMMILKKPSVLILGEDFISLVKKLLKRK